MLHGCMLHGRCSLRSRQGHHVVLQLQELTADADKAVHVRRSDGDASQKLMQQENLLLRAKVAHAKQMLQRNSDNSLDILR